MHNLREDSDVCLEDFVSRAEVISTTGCIVMISDFQEYHRLVAYLSRYTAKPIGLAMGLAGLESLFDEQYYDDLDGGILESFGRLFKEQLKLLVYPRKDESKGIVECLDSLALCDSRQHLLDYLRTRGFIVPLHDVSHKYLDIHSPDVLRLISSGSREWTDMVPDSVAAIIKDQQLFGYAG